MKNLLVLGLDSLEYSLVRDNDFKNLKQSKYGKLEINLPRLITPEIWTSFLTGKKPSEHGVRVWYANVLRFIGKLKISDKIGKKFGFLQPLITKGNFTVRDLLQSTVDPNTKFAEIMRGESGIRTVLDYAERPRLVLNPFSESKFDYGQKYERLRKKLVRSMEDSDEREELKEEMLEFYDGKKRAIIEDVGLDWDFFITHIYISDVFQHIFWNDEKTIMNLYWDIDDFVGRVKEKIPDDTKVLILSDHGQEKGIHTPYGFFSYNESLVNWIREQGNDFDVDFDSPKITDFYEPMKAIISPERFQRERIKNHLEELGY